MNHLANFTIRYAKFIVLCCALISLVMALGMTRLETRNNYEGNLPADDPIIRTNARFEQFFGNEQIMMVALESDALLTPASIKKIAQISAALAAVDGVPKNGVTSLATLPAPPGGIAASSLLGWLLQNPGLGHDYLQQHLSGDSLAGNLLSRDGSTALILVRLVRPAAQQIVARQVGEIIAKFAGPERIYAIGDPIVAQAIDEGIQSDLRTLLPLALTLILVGFFASFRTLRGMLLPLLVILLSIVWTLGLMAYLEFQLNVVTSAIPILLVAVASSYGIHVIHRFNGETSGGERAIRRVLQRLGPAVILTGITSAIGMLTLLLFRIHSVREFGLFAAAGIFFATLLATVLIPAILALLKPPRQRRHRERKKRFGGTSILLGLGAFSLRYRRLMLLVAVLLMAGSVVGVQRIRLGIDPVELFPAEHPFQQASRVFNERFSGWRYFDIMVEGPEAGALKSPSFLKSITAFQQAAGSLQKVGSTRSPVDVLGEIQASKTPVSEQGMEALFQGLRGENSWVDQDLRRARIAVLITTSDHEEQRVLYRRLQDLARTCFAADYRIEFGGTVLLWIAGNRYVAMGKIYNIAAAVLFMLAFCAAVFRSASKGFLCVIPLAVGVSCSFGTMGFCDIRLNIATAIVTSIGVGIGVDFAIHFFSRLQEELAAGLALPEATQRTLLTAGKAICFDAVSNVLGFLAFTFSGFGPLQNLGWLVVLTMVACALGTLLLLPPLVATFGAKRPAAQ